MNCGNLNRNFHSFLVCPVLHCAGFVPCETSAVITIKRYFYVAGLLSGKPVGEKIVTVLTPLQITKLPKNVNPPACHAEEQPVPQGGKAPDFSIKRMFQVQTGSALPAP